jgi:hypothetical protein
LPIPLPVLFVFPPFVFFLSPLTQIEAAAELKAALQEIAEARAEMEATLTDAERDLRERKYKAVLETIQARVHAFTLSQPGGGPHDLFTLEVSCINFGARWSIRREFEWFQTLEDRLRAAYALLTPEEGGQMADADAGWKFRV